MSKRRELIQTERTLSLAIVACATAIGFALAAGCDNPAAPIVGAAGAAGSAAAVAPASTAPAAPSAAMPAMPAAGATSMASATVSSIAAAPTAADTPSMPSSAAAGNSESSMPPSAAGGAATPSVAQKPPQAIPETFMADAGDGWKTLITSRWEVPPGEELYQCARFTVPQDVNVGGFRALSPPGTHHTFLMVSDTASQADGTEKCSAATVGTRNITGSGVGTNDFMMPAGVATKLKKGQQLILNLHLFNVSDKPITGISGTLVKTSADADVKQFAEGILAGPISLDIPPGGPTVQSGQCTLKRDVTLFGVIPHMHQLGIHLKAVARSSVMGDVVLSDRPYDFDTQIVYPLDKEIPMRAGDMIDVDCTYQNTTPNPVSFGESSLDEMCFAGIYQYPAGSDSFICVL